MRLRTSAAALASLGVSLTVLPHAAALGSTLSRATIVTPRPIPRSDSARSHVTRAFGRRNAAGCTENFGTPSQIFVGETGGNTNIAGGQFSSVTAGEFDDACGIDSSVSSGDTNVIATGGPYSFIGAGSQNGIAGGGSAIAAGYSNYVTGGDSFVGGGYYGAVSGSSAFLGAGGFGYFEFNATPQDAPANSVGSYDAFVGSGDLNAITTAGNGSFIGAGGYAYARTGASGFGNQVSGTDSFVGTGDQNTVAANTAFIGAGTNNAIASSATNAFVGAGARNAASGQYSAIVGGYGNIASGSYAVVAGGDGDTAAGTLSFAGGYHADAAHNGSFVWSDYASGSAVVKDRSANQFVVRASGGTIFYSSEGATVGVELMPGDGTWSSLSDRNAKVGVVPLDDEAVLAKVSALPVSEWRYGTARGERHIGPMAQDFYAAFGAGSDDRHIASIDEDGVALAAIKALHRDVRAKDATIARLESRLTAVERRLDVIAPK